MKAKTNNQSESKRTARPPKANRSAARAVTWGVLILIGCYLAHGFGRLMAEWRAATQRAPERAVASSLAPALPAPLPLSGQWSFAQIDLNMSSRVVSNKQLEERFERLPADDDAPSIDLSGTSLSEIHRELAALGDSLQLETDDATSVRRYRVDRPDFQAQLVVDQSEAGERIRDMAVAIRQEDGDWQLMEFLPESVSEKSPSTESRLMPLPGGAKLEASRLDADGNPLLELVSTETTAQDLIQLWQNAGWTVRAANLGREGNFSYLCARGESVVYAWTADDAQRIENLMLVLAPEDATGVR